MNQKYHRDLSVLTARIAEGDEDAFCEIYKRYYNRLFRYGSIILSEENVVEDIIQDLFIWVWENPKQVGRINNLEIYLFQCLKRNLREIIKKNLRTDRFKRAFTLQNSNNYLEESIECKRIQEEDFKMKLELVHQHLLHLPARQKETIFLRFYAEFSYDEIAEILSTSNQVARNYVSRALKQLRKLSKLSLGISNSPI